MRTIVLALHCHPDDIEFAFAGTLFLLKDRGCELHYLTLANGSCGSSIHGIEDTVRLRAQEARNAAACLGAEFHESIVNDLEVFHTNDIIRRVVATIRRIQPDIMLVPAMEDYMEDHMNTSRVAVTAAFARGMRNFTSFPPLAPIDKDVTLYHGLPHGLRDGLRRRVVPDFFVDISAVIQEKERMLACHESQKQWLDESQGMDAYLLAMREMSAQAGNMSGRFAYAEGWTRHNHLGYSRSEIDPLADLLKEHICLASPRQAEE